MSLSTYEVGAFEALEWAWNLLRENDGVNIEDVTRHIQEMLLTLSNGTRINFQQKANALRSMPH